MTPVLTNPQARRARSARALGRRATRVQRGQFLVEGPHAVAEALRHRPDAVHEVFVHRRPTGSVLQVATMAHDAGAAVHESDERVLASLSDTKSPQGVVAVCRQLDQPLAVILAQCPRVLLVLARVRDPGNAGTVLRAADAAGVDAVLVSAESVDVYNPKAVRASAGSLFHLPVATGLPLADLFTQLREHAVRLLATDGRGTTTLGEVDLSTPHGWIVGNEAWGLDEQSRRECDEVVRIPIYGHAESLNLAMATTLCVYASASAVHATRDR